ncbi:quinoprotein dehydrogenase-associated putative ABC transporter substrate-binding protein [Paracoccus seriniphilus]|uniref:Amino acid ABC transporter substrate-binding protein, PAAT family n=1 Tax=Paracoccus seriniphilus TaxID=184748 RepID=A0A239PXJ1_9RHOB|nr:quinoprotein dehydrogenase-associated putative ABC transporter substrate-binding protein [Paracoccus seriniphilus]WCR14100.1 quinoprotein dehydrogenase-associated putative ABC transporter substrate-binding protein [Paracoccus seriniphilus]SNT75004.1 amino acid ABC transporter substrate-binding protein, PAAT family [Paracoccus seriniphilus]
MRRLIITAISGWLCVAHMGAAQVADLRSTTSFRVCADPANAPMSHKDGSGFENRLAAQFGEWLDLPVTYSWFPSGMGFITKTLRAGTCDVVMGYAQGDELVQNTNHYYTSVFGIVTRKDSALADVDHLGDPVLKDHPIGVIAGSPPATIMARAGLAKDMRGGDLFVDRRVKDPVGRMIDSVRDGSLDAAVLWGPLAGPRIKDDPDLQFTPLLREKSGPKMFYRITMGVRPGEQEWKRQLNSLIRRHQDEINQTLREAGVPLVDDYGKEMLP